MGDFPSPLISDFVSVTVSLLSLCRFSGRGTVLCKVTGPSLFSTDLSLALLLTHTPSCHLSLYSLNKPEVTLHGGSSCWELPYGPGESHLPLCLPRMQTPCQPHAPDPSPRPLPAQGSHSLPHPGLHSLDIDDAKRRVSQNGLLGGQRGWPPEGAYGTQVAPSAAAVRRHDAAGGVHPWSAL